MTRAGEAHRKDAFGDPLPRGAIARIGTRRLRFPHPQSLAISDDGALVAAGGRGCRAAVWDPVTAHTLARVSSKGRDHMSYCALAFSPDGGTLLTEHKTADEAFLLEAWAVADGSLRWRQPVGWSGSTQLLHTGTAIVISLRDGFSLLDPATGAELAHLSTVWAPSPLWRGTLSADGRLFAAYVGSRFVWFEPSAGATVHSLEAPGFSLLGVALVGDGPILHAFGKMGTPVHGESGTWAVDLESRTIRQVDTALMVAQHASGRRAYSLETELVIEGLDLRLPWKQVHSVSLLPRFSRDGSRLAVPRLHGVEVIDLRTGTRHYHLEDVARAWFVGDGDVVAWETTTEADHETHRLMHRRLPDGPDEAQEHDPRAATIRVSIGGDRLVRGERGYSLHPRGATAVDLVDDDGAAVVGMAISADGRFVVGGVGLPNSNDLRVFDAGGREIARFKDDVNRQISSVAIAPGLGWVVTVGSGGRPAIWDLRTGTRLHPEFPDHQTGPRAIVVDPAERWVATHGDGRFVDLFSTERLETLGQLDPRTPIHSLRPSPDGALLAAAAQRHVMIWDVERRVEVAHLAHPGVRHVIFSPDGRRLVSVGDGEALIWDVPDLAPPQEAVGSASKE